MTKQEAITTFTPYVKLPEQKFCPMQSPDFEKMIGFKSEDVFDEAIRKAGEIYTKGSLAYKTLTNGVGTSVQEGVSQIFWNLHINQFLPKGFHIMTIQDMEGIFAKKSDYFSEHYADTTQGVLRSNQSSYAQNKFLVDKLSKAITRALKEEKIKGASIEYSSQNPLVISGLKPILDKKNSDYGLAFKINDVSVSNDSRFAHTGVSPRIEIFGGVEKKLYTQNDSFAGVYAGDGSIVYSNYPVLPGSYRDGWVVVVSDFVEGANSQILTRIEEEAKKNKSDYEKRKIELIKIIRKL